MIEFIKHNWGAIVFWVALCAFILSVPFWLKPAPMKVTVFSPSPGVECAMTTNLRPAMSCWKTQ